MKKIFLPVILLLVSAWAWSQAFPFIKDRQYAFYLDSRNGMDIRRAYMSFRLETGDIMFLIRNTDRQSGEELDYITVIGEDDEGFPKIVSLYGFQDTDPPEFRMSVMDLLNFLSFTSMNMDLITDSVLLEDPWEDGTRIFSMNRFLPMFLFDTIQIKGTGALVYKLTAAGTMTPAEDPEETVRTFFHMDPQETSLAEDSKDWTVPDQDLFRINFSGPVSILLDFNWISDEFEGSPAYRLSLFSDNDARIILKNDTLENLKALTGSETVNDLYRSITFIPDTVILMDTFHAEESDGVYRVSYSMKDREGRLKYTEIHAWQDEEKMYILIFTGLTGIYDQNTEYIRTILDSVREEE